MPDYIDISEQDFSFLGKGSKIKGEFKLMGPTHLNSFVEGDIEMIDNSDLSIEKDGSVTGRIKCHNIDIYGHFEGVLEASGRIVVYPSAGIKGEINASGLVVHPGATLNVDAHTENTVSGPGN